MTFWFSIIISMIISGSNLRICLAADTPLQDIKVAPIASGAEKSSEGEKPSAWGGPTATLTAADQKPEEISTQIRDPFARPKVFQESNIPRSELETISLDSFKVIGVITGPLKKKAMLSANGKTYFVAPNVKIGMKNGFVLDIQGDAVIVREKIVNLLGREENQDIQLKVGPEKPIIGGQGS